MSKNLDQIFIANPITTNVSTDLMYFMQSPYTSGTDAGMTYANFAAQFPTPAAVQQDTYNVTTDTGLSGAAYVAALTPPTSALTDGLRVILKPLRDNTVITPTLDLDGHGPKNIVMAQSADILALGDIFGGGIAVLIYSLANDWWELQNPAKALEDVNLVNGVWTFVNDTGSANAYVGNPPLFGSGNLSLVQGMELTLFPANANTGASTFNYGGTGAVAIQTIDGSALSSGMMKASGGAKLFYNGTVWQLLNPFSSGGVTSTQVQQSAFNVSTSSSNIGNAYTAVFSPAITSLVDGMIVTVKNWPNTNTNDLSSPATLDVGTGALNIYLMTVGLPPLLGVLNLPAVAGSLQGTWDYNFQYSANEAAFYLLDSSSNITAETQIAQSYVYTIDSGTVNNIVLTYNSVVSSGGFVSPPSRFTFTASNTNTGDTNVTINSLSGLQIISNRTAAALVGGEIIAGATYDIFINSDHTTAQLLNPSIG